MTSRPIPPLARPAGEAEIEVLAQTPSWTNRAAQKTTLGLVLLVLILLLAPWQQTALGVGRVISYSPTDRQQVVEAPIKGRVAGWFVTEGQQVRAGELLLRMVDNDPGYLERLRVEKRLLEIQRAAQDAKVEDYEAKVQAEIRARDSALLVLEATTEQLTEERLALRQLVQAEVAALDIATTQRDRTASLQAEGLASQRKLEQATLKRRTQAAKVAAARAKLRIVKAKLEAQRAKRAKLQQDAEAKIAASRAALRSAESKRAEIDQKLQKLETKIQRQATQEAVTAPRDGTVLRLLAQVGQDQIKAGDPLLILVPTIQRKAVEVWIDGNDMPLVQPGQRARLLFDGWPAVQLTGWPSVAVGTFGGVVDFVDVAPDAKGRFRAVLVPDPEDDPWPDGRYLRQGVRAKAWVQLATVRLGFELWRQLNGFPPSVELPPLPGTKGSTGKGSAKGSGAK